MDESLIKAMFIRAYNRLIEQNEDTIQNCELVVEMLSDFSDIDESIQTWQNEQTIVETAARTLIQENAKGPQPQTVYQQKYDHLTKRYQEAVSYLESLEAEKKDRRDRIRKVEAFIQPLRNDGSFMVQWEDAIWTATVEKGIIHKDKSITFVFCNGAEIEVKP